MELNEYQKLALKTAIYPRKLSVIYPALGLNGEAGEVAEKVKKIIRDKDGNFDNLNTIHDIAKELGDVLWYLSAIANDLGLSLNDVAKINIKKLQNRQDKNALHGSGDNR